MRDVNVQKIVTRVAWALMALVAVYGLRQSIVEFIYCLQTMTQEPVWGPLHATAEAVFVVAGFMLVNVTVRCLIHPPTKDRHA